MTKKQVDKTKHPNTNDPKDDLSSNANIPHSKLIVGTLDDKIIEQIDSKTWIALKPQSKTSQEDKIAALKKHMGVYDAAPLRGQSHINTINAKKKKSND